MSAGRVIDRRVALALAAFTVCGGCSLFRGEEMVGPYSYNRQSAEIQKLVRIGDPQRDVVQTLEKAGMVGEYSRFGSRINDTVYYCQIWNRADGEVWQMSVSLLFEERRLAGIALYDAAGDVDAGSGRNHPATTTGFPRTQNTAGARRTANQPSPWSTGSRRSAQPQPLNGRDARRQPFPTP